MRILQICQRPQRRGAEIFAVQLSAELRRQGHEVMIAYLYPHSGKGLLHPSPDDRMLGGDDDHPLETLVGYHPALLRRLAEVMSSFQPDITQVNGARTVKYGVLARSFKRAPAGAIVYRNIGTFEDWVRGPRRQLFYRTIFRKVDGVVGISQSSMRSLASVFTEKTPRTVISNAVDPEALRPVVARGEIRALAGTPDAAPVAIFVGSLTPEKRVDRLIAALGRVREGGHDLRLWIVGEGPLRGKLEEQVRHGNMEPAVHFFGTRDDVASCLAAADLLALTSETEGVPAAVLEAGLLGLPVVATRVGALPECVGDGETGLLVPSGDEEALVTALGRLAGDAELRARLGTAAKERVLERHSIGQITREYVDFYESLIRVRRGSAEPRHSAGQAGTGSRFSKEMRLVVLLARPELEPARESRVRDMLARGIDWGEFLALARRHRLSPLVALHLRRHRENVPPEAEKALSEAQFSNSLRILKRTGQLLEVLGELRKKEIVAVPYKGPALGAQLYGSGALRLAGDLDIVVHPRDVAEARAVLGELGYRPNVPLAQDEVRFMVRHRYHEGFLRDDGGHVELHWAFTNRDVPFALDLEEPFSRVRPVELSGQVVPAFHSEDLLLILCVHGAKHRWDRLEWLAGVAQVLRGQDELDWDALLRRATSLGVLRTLFLGLSLADEILEAPVPAAVLERVREDRATGALTAQVLEILCLDPAGWDVPDLLQRDGFRMLIRERLLDRVRFVWHRATTPSDPDQWDVTRIGPWDVPRHAFRRPFLVLTQLMVALSVLKPRLSDVE